ncbi:MAG: glycosyltransferase family 2 protein [Phycisphaerae bacterium]
MTLLTWIFAAYLVLGLIYWAFSIAGIILAMRSIPVLRTAGGATGIARPSVSVIMAACNEEGTIEPAVRGLLADDNPGLEVILVDDRSTDDTGAIIDRIAAQEPRIRAVHVRELPEGWLGKVHALKCGAEIAKGEWLLFSDADVHIKPGTIEAVIEHCRRHKLDFLAGIPRVWKADFPVDAGIAMALRSVMVGMRVWAVSDPKSSAFMGVGAFDLVRRDALMRTGGFELIRLGVADDAALGMVMKQSGAACAMVNLRDHVGLYWYRHWRDLAVGSEKSYATMARCNPWRGAVVLAVAMAAELSPLAAVVAWGHPAIQWAGAVAAATIAAALALAARWFGRPMPSAALWPIGVFVMLSICVRATFLGVRRGGLMWRGTLYRSKNLREGMHVRFPARRR